jgi:hypothetical protein
MQTNREQNKYVSSQVGICAESNSGSSILNVVTAGCDFRALLEREYWLLNGTKLSVSHTPHK